MPRSVVTSTCVPRGSKRATVSLLRTVAPCFFASESWTRTHGSGPGRGARPGDRPRRWTAARCDRVACPTRTDLTRGDTSARSVRDIGNSSLWPHRTRARDLGVDRGRALESSDLCPTVHQPTHCGSTRLTHPQQARRQQPGDGRRNCRPASTNTTRLTSVCWGSGDGSARRSAPQWGRSFSPTRSALRAVRSRAGCT